MILGPGLPVATPADRGFNLRPIRVPRFCASPDTYLPGGASAPFFRRGLRRSEPRWVRPASCRGVVTPAGSLAEKAPPWPPVAGPASTPFLAPRGGYTRRRVGRVAVAASGPVGGSPAMSAPRPAGAEPRWVHPASCRGVVTPAGCLAEKAPPWPPVAGPAGTLPRAAEWLHPQAGWMGALAAGP